MPGLAVQSGGADRPGLAGPRGKSVPLQCQPHTPPLPVPGERPPGPAPPRQGHRPGQLNAFCGDTAHGRGGPLISIYTLFTWDGELWQNHASNLS